VNFLVGEGQRLTTQVGDLTGFAGEGSSCADTIEADVEIAVDEPEIGRCIGNGGVTFGDEDHIREDFRQLDGLVDELTTVRPDDVVTEVDVFAHGTVNIRHRNALGINRFDA